MPKSFEPIDSGRIKAWVQGVPVEEEAWQQLKNVAALSIVRPWVSVMPDVHVGIGATVGSVIPTEHAIIPAAVGVDIGCGMMAVQTSLALNDFSVNLNKLRLSIEQAIPHGRTSPRKGSDKGSWKKIPKIVKDTWYPLEKTYQVLCSKHPKLSKGNDVNQLGTLGTGNHFIEVCYDENNVVWLMLHSGSRGVGNRIGNYFIELAKNDMRVHLKNIPDENLAYLKEGTQHFDDYLQAVEWAQLFALKNREVMMQSLVDILRMWFPSLTLNKIAVNCHHNYVSREKHFGREVWITRKGAVRAQRGELGIIPGSMGACSYIVEGLGNAESFHSCSHGAGRIMSRTKAKEIFSIEDHRKATAGIECRKDKEVIDETPRAYKDLEAVMRAQAELVTIRHRLKQIIVVKG